MLFLTLSAQLSLCNTFPAAAPHTTAASRFTADEYTLGLWHFDEGSGSTVGDDSSHNNHGSFGPTAPNWVAGVTGEPGDYALSFDDRLAYVLLPHNPDGSLTFQGCKEFTIELWVYVRQISRDGYHWNAIMGTAEDSGGASWGLAQCEDYPCFYPYFRDTHEGFPQADCNPTPLLQWTQITVVYDGQYLSMYFDSALQNVRYVGQFEVQDVDAPFTIGKKLWNDYAWYESENCIVDEVRISSIDRIGGWPSFRHDLTNSGYTNTVTAPDTNHTSWIRKMGQDVYGTAAVANGRIYCSANDETEPGVWVGTLYCLDAFTGEHLWKYPTSAAICSSPAVEEGKVYVTSYDKNIYCLDALNGTRIWNYTIGDSIYSSPAIFEGRAYFGGGKTNTVYCLNASNGVQLWNYATSGEIPSSPGIASGKVFIGSYDGSLYCLDAYTGTLAWTYTSGGWVFTSPSFDNGRVYFGAAGPQKIYCVNASDGAFIWNHYSGWIESSPAVVSGKVYFGNPDDGRVYCLNATDGSDIWNSLAGGWIHGSQSVADGKVYATSENHNIYCFNASDGTSIWSYVTGNLVRSSPVIAYGNVYIGSQDGHLYVFGPKHFLAVTSIRPSKTVVGLGSSCTVSVLIEKHFNYTGDDVSIDILANDSFFLQTVIVPSTSPENPILDFVWDTTGLPYGYYNFYEHGPQSWQNNYVSLTNFGLIKQGYVVITIPGDAKGDGLVNVLDLILIATHIGHENGGGHVPYSTQWYNCVNCDVKEDGKINVLDLILTAMHLGQHI